MPLNPTVSVPPTVELLEMVSVPLAAPAVAGLNATRTAAVWPGSRVIGKEPAGMEKPVPEILTEFMVNAAVPEDDNVSVCVDVVFSA